PGPCFVSCRGLARRVTPEKVSARAAVRRAGAGETRILPLCGHRGNSLGPGRAPCAGGVAPDPVFAGFFPSIAGATPGAWGARGVSAAAASEHFLLDLLEARVAHVLALDEVDDVLADVAGVVADALERARRPDDVERSGDGARVLHHESDHLADDGLLLLVDVAVFARGLERRLRVHARERIERVVQHAAHVVPERLDLGIVVLRPLLGGEAHRHACDLLGLVADALAVGAGL